MYGYPNSVGIIRISLDLIRYEFFLSKSNLMVNFTPKVPVGRRGHWFSLPFYTSNPLSSSAVIIIYVWIQFPTGFKGLDKCMFIRIGLNKEKCVQLIINIAKGICKRPGGYRYILVKFFGPIIF